MCQEVIYFAAMAAQFVATAAILSCLLALASCNSEGDILYAQRMSWKDPNNVLESWDPTLVNPCTWFHITCNNNNSVIRVYVSTVYLLPYLYYEKHLDRPSGLETLQVLLFKI